MNLEKFISEAREIHGDKYDYSNSSIIADKVEIKCPIHGSFWQNLSSHLKGIGCLPCGFLKAIRNKHARLAKIFIPRAIEIHGDKYDYSKSIYKSAIDNVIIICAVHGEFMQSPNQHLGGRGCRLCGIMRRARGRKRSFSEFVTLANKKHSNKYEYVKFVSGRKIEIICPDHGSFWQRTQDHLRGRGCYHCGLVQRARSKKKTTKEFVEQAGLIHEGKYDYAKVKYIHGRKKIEILCLEHGSFWQTPEGHLSGRGCRKCVGFISKKETAWLDSLGLPRGPKYRNVLVGLSCGKSRRVDGFSPDENIVYEFYGDFWHGNPKIYNSKDINRVNKISFGQLYERTFKREKALKAAGYNVIHIWESEFDKL